MACRRLCGAERFVQGFGRRPCPPRRFLAEKYVITVLLEMRSGCLLYYGTGEGRRGTKDIADKRQTEIAERLSRTCAPSKGWGGW